MPKSPAKSWRDVYDIHPAAEMFPRLTDAELFALGEDIKKNGGKPLHPVILWSKGHRDYETVPKRLLLDGISRLDAMEKVGLPTLDRKGVLKVPNERKYELRRVISFSLNSGPTSRSKEQLVPDTDPYVYVLSANAHRRHLSNEQKRELVKKTKPHGRLGVPIFTGIAGVVLDTPDGPQTKYYWWADENENLSSEQIMETTGLHGPFDTEAEALEAARTSPRCAP